MIKAIIIDDEQHCINQLTKLLEHHCAEHVTICGSYNNISSAAEGIRMLNPGLVFLDVMLNNDTGFDLLRQLPAINFELIFTTAYDEYAIDAFRFSALDYLLKPINPEELMAAVEKLTKKTTLQMNHGQLATLLSNLKTEGQEKRLAIPNMQGVDFINLSSIIRCQSEGNYTIIYLKDGRKITVARTLKDFEELLSGYDFFRVHNSHIVNLSHVKSYSKSKVGHIVMMDESQVEVATRRKDEFMKKMLQ